MRYNGTFNYRSNSEPTTDPTTGFIVKGAEMPLSRGCECQIDYSIPARQIVGTDGQTIAYTYDIFIPKYFKGEISVGDTLILLQPNGDEIAEITVLGVDTLNRKYIEIWG